MNTHRVPVSCPPGFQGRYTVRAGDTMFLIAQRYGVSLNSLIAANPQISNPSVLHPGDVLCVPGAGAGDCRHPSSCPPGFQGRYTVQPGDSMYTIAQRYAVSLDALIAANPQITNPNQIHPCDVLCVPGSSSQCREPTSCPPGFQGRYTVQPGDSMYSIAQHYGVSLNALIAANPQITNPNEIHPCDVLCVPGTTQLDIPCTAILNPTQHIITDAAGSALVRFLSSNQRSISVLGVGIPEPSTLGNFNGYQGRVVFPPPEDRGFEFLLTHTPSTPSQPETWSGSLNFTVGMGWPPDTMIVVRPINTNTHNTGSAVLLGTLTDCCN